MGMTMTKEPRRQPPAHQRARTQPSPAQNATAIAPPVRSLTALQRLADQSPVVQRLHDLAPLQRMDEEELMQGKMIQRMEEEELQMKPVQRIEEDELQGKFIQRAKAPTTNSTGLPDNLKSGIENLSGMSMDHVKVHRNSDKPATVQAHAYAQGSDIHLAPGQERHLPHEAWHVVQQAQGRVKPTIQMVGLAVNDDEGLEKEADVMGARAASLSSNEVNSQGLTKLHATRGEVKQASLITVKRVEAGGNLFMGKSTAGAPALAHGGGTNWYGPKVTAAEYGTAPGGVWRVTAAHALNLVDMSTSDSVKKIMSETARRRGVNGLSPNLQAALGNHNFAYAIPNAVAATADAYLHYGAESYAGNGPVWPGNQYGVTQGDVNNAVALANAPNEIALWVGSVIQQFAGHTGAQAVTLDNPAFLANPDGYRMVRKDATNLDAGFADALLNDLNDPNLFHGLHVPLGMKFGGWTGTKHEILIKDSPNNLNLQGQVNVPGPEADLAVRDKWLGIDDSILARAWRFFGLNG